MKLRAFIVGAAVVLFAACGTTYRASDTSVVIVPNNIQTSFTTQYPGAINAVWEYYDPAVEPMIDWDLAGWAVLDNNDYVVRFNLDNQDYYAWYDQNGDWIGTAYVITDYAMLPSAVNTTLNDRYAGYHITKVEREFQKDRMAYEIVLVRSSDESKIKLLVAPDGTIIKEKVKS